MIPGTLGDSPYVLDGLLEHQTSLHPKQMMTDTAGYSDIVFGLFWLLGFQFSPRLADLGDSRFWRIDRTADYGALNEIARHRASIKLITQNWDDLLRVGGSLKMGLVRPSELIRVLQRGSKRSMLARAIGELGRIPKTIHLLTFINDPAYRRRILTQLNRGEGPPPSGTKVLPWPTGRTAAEVPGGTGGSARSAWLGVECTDSLEHAVHGRGSQSPAFSRATFGRCEIRTTQTELLRREIA